MDGWQPSETHHHYDADGNYTGRTVVERETEWDEESVGELLGLAEADDLICPDCGNLREVCSDPERDLYPQRRTCYVSAVRERSDRLWHKKHQSAKPDPNGYLPTDGVRIWASPHDLTPDDDFI